ncbi:MAG: PQQ-dependent sugar dehydrogenase, partial [Acidimicrobiales bacterium]
MNRLLAGLVLVAMVACSGSGGDGAASSPSDSIAPPMDPAQARATIVKVADVTNPTAMAVRPDDDGIYVADKGGQVRRVPKGQTSSPGPVDAAPVLDLAGQVSTGGEQGLLGLTFSPDGSKLYLHYTDRAGDSQVVEYAFRNGRAEVSTRRVLISLDQPFSNHNGGEVVFGPDGKLYVGFGDGGGQGDPSGNGQNLDTLFAKILRIDPQPSGDQAYTVPADNPFAGRADAAAETWMYGLRNPWRFSWDRATGDLWIGDVGQNQYEEIDFVAAGQ